jgi:hypothetical protein
MELLNVIKLKLQETYRCNWKKSYRRTSNEYFDEPQRKGDSTVTLTHSRTKDLAEFTKNADIIITALGVPEF